MSSNISNGEALIESVWLKRLEKDADLKKSIAITTLKSNLISPFDHLFIDCGSTFSYLAHEIFSSIKNLFPLTIYTTNIDVFQKYLMTDDKDLIDFRLIGGRFIPHHQSFDGDNYSISSLSNDSVIDCAFIGACPIDSKLRIMGTITDVVRIKKNIIKHSAEVVILCDESKFLEESPSGRVVGSLVPQKGELFLTLEDDELLVPAKVIVGVNDNQNPSNELRKFLAKMESHGLIANNKIILSRLGGKKL